MKICCLLLYGISVAISSELSYRGTVGQQPVELVLEFDLETNTNGVYADEKNHRTVELIGSQRGQRLELVEHGEGRFQGAVWRFDRFDLLHPELLGERLGKDSSWHEPIFLRKVWGYGAGDSGELLQLETTKRHYFHLLVVQDRVSGVKIFDQKTGRLIQTLALDGESRGYRNLAVADYNFDGHEDFSIFESSYAGANTSRLYVLYDPQKRNFFLSTFSGTSLAFDPHTKTISEYNQCCAGRSITNTTYKVVANQMVRLEQSCSEYDDATESFVPGKCDE